MRVALGATRGRLIRMLLTESLGLAVVGALTGAVLFVGLTRALSNVALPALLRSVDLQLGIDAGVIVYALALTLLTGVLCGLIPAWRVTRTNVVSEVARAGQSSTGRLWARHVFVVGQVAASMILLVLSSLLLLGLTRVTTLDPGFDIDRVAVAMVNVEASRYAMDGGLALGERLVERIAALPGVETTSFAGIVALGMNQSSTFLQVQGVPPGSVGSRTFVNSVGLRYFDTLGIPLVSGRDFDPSDREGAPSVAIVNEAFARAYLPGQNALGKLVRRLGRDQFSEIIGIVRDSKYGSVAEDPAPILYAAYAQDPRISTEIRPVVIHVRTVGEPTAIVRELRRVIVDLAPAAFVQVQTLRDATSAEAQLRGFGTWMIGTLGSVALLLAMIGLYGTIAFVVSSRTREIGLRMALGASSRLILGNVVAQGVRLMAIGIAIGSVVAWMLARALAAGLAGLSSADPVAYGSATLILFLVGLTAIYFPARRAAALNPVEALRVP